MITSTGVSIAYDDLGHGEPALLFLPGWCSNRTVFAAVAPHCSRWRRALVLDWRGHGESGAAAGDFGTPELVDDARALIQASGVQQIVPVAHSHADWVAIELHRQLEAQIAQLVLLDWLVLDPPPPFRAALQRLQSPAQWRRTVEQLFALWQAGGDNRAVSQFIEHEMGAYEFAMWARAAREIGRAYTQAGSPLQALAAGASAVPVLHLYAQPAEASYWQAQQAFASTHPWFRVHKLRARTHFPMLEAPEEVVAALEQFIFRVTR